MTGPSECHMCGRCSGLHGAIALAARSPNREVATLDPNATNSWDAALIVFGMIGLALGAFEWSATTAFVSLRSAAIGLIVDHGPAWLLADNAPWWLLTNYPEAHDVFTWLDGALIVGYRIVGTAPGRRLGEPSGWLSRPREWRVVAGPTRAYALAYTLIPLAGAGLFVGLSALPATLAHGEGLRLAWLPHVRAVLLAASACWSLYLAYRQLEGRLAGATRAGALLAMTFAIGGVLAAWAPFVYH